MITYAHEYYVSKCTLGNVCSMQILTKTQTSNNSNFIQFLEMLSTYVSFVYRLLFYYHVYWRLQSTTKMKLTFSRILLLHYFQVFVG